MWQYRYSDELYHYGVKGMKWGVITKKEPVGKSRRKSTKADDPSTKPPKKKSKHRLKLEAKYKEKGLTDEEAAKEADKRIKAEIIVGSAAAVAVTALAAYGGYKLYKGYHDTGAKIDPETGFRLIDGPETDEETLQKINPGRVKFLSGHKNKEIISGSSQNCMLCTTTYELRKRGYDVHAGLSTEGYTPEDVFPKIFSNYKGTTDIPSFQVDEATKTVLSASPEDKLKNIEKVLKSEGSGARGNIMVYWKNFGGGHSMIWENVDGNITFKDGQTGEVYKDFAKDILSKTNNIAPVRVLRTDNLQLNTSAIKDYINADNLTKTYVDHGAEVVAAWAMDPVVDLTAATAVSTAVTVSKSKKIKNYRSQHPNTKLSNKEILQMLSAQKKG